VIRKLSELTNEVEELKKIVRGKAVSTEQTSDIDLEQADSINELLKLEEKIKEDNQYSRKLVCNAHVCIGGGLQSLLIPASIKIIIPYYGTLREYINARIN